MISRNQIRQTVAQYLYGAGMSTPDSLGNDEFWEVLLETNIHALNKARAKAVEHLTRDYADKVRVFKTRANDFMSLSQGNIKLESLRELLNDIVVRETSFEDALHALRSARKNDPSCETDAVDKAIAGLNVINATLIQFRSRFFDMLQDCPEYAAQAAGLVKSMKSMEKVSRNIDELEHPQDGANTSEFRNVIEMRDDIKELREEAEKMGNAVLSKAGELDELINGVIENFSQERISPIERAVIRLAAYELKYKEDLPVPVIVSEAMSLAERFSTTEAPRFINGVLASLAQKCRNAESAPQ